MSIQIPPDGLTFEFGSALTVLTTAARGVHRGKTLCLQGIFTGVVLEDTELNLTRASKHITVSMDGDYFGHGECCGKVHDTDKGYDQGYKHDTDEDHSEWPESKKCKDHDKWPEPDKDEDHSEWPESKKCKDHDKWPEPDKDEDHSEWPESKKCKDHDKWPKPDKDEDYIEWPKKCKHHHKGHKPNHHCHKHPSEQECDGKKCEPKCIVKDEEYLVLSLTRPSFPFVPGQIVWISMDQIVALATVCQK